MVNGIPVIAWKYLHEVPYRCTSYIHGVWMEVETSSSCLPSTISLEQKHHWRTHYACISTNTAVQMSVIKLPWHNIWIWRGHNNICEQLAAKQPTWSLITTYFLWTEDKTVTLGWPPTRETTPDFSQRTQKYLVALVIQAVHCSLEPLLVQQLPALQSTPHYPCGKKRRKHEFFLLKPRSQDPHTCASQQVDLTDACPGQQSYLKTMMWSQSFFGGESCGRQGKLSRQSKLIQYCKSQWHCSPN